MTTVRRKREYSYQKVWFAYCHDCNENIAERGDEGDTKKSAEDAVRSHEAWHQRCEAEGLD